MELENTQTHNKSNYKHYNMYNPACYAKEVSTMRNHSDFITVH